MSSLGRSPRDGGFPHKMVSHFDMRQASIVGAEYLVIAPQDRDDAFTVVVVLDV